MTTSSLPSKANLEHLRSQAKTLLISFREGNPDSIARVAIVYGADARQTSRGLRLTHAQFVIAREYGFGSWTRLKTHLAIQAASAEKSGSDIERGAELYEKMLDQIRSAKTLSADIHSVTSSNARVSFRSGALLRARKPYQAHIESWIMYPDDGEIAHGQSVCVADGHNFWCYWPNGRANEISRTMEHDVYYHAPSPTGLAAPNREMIMSLGMVSSAVDIRTLHGGRDVQRKKDDVFRWTGAEDIDGHHCDLLDITSSQSTTRLWISATDHLPRRHIWRQEDESVDESVMESDERWTNVMVDADLPDSLFQWEPPAGWRQWYYPEPGAQLIRAETMAPDFEISGLNGETYTQAMYRGKILVLVLSWSCRQENSKAEAAILQRVHQQCLECGANLLVVANFGETKNGLLAFQAEQSVDFAIAHDHARMFRLLQQYGAFGASNLVIIGPDGIVIDSSVCNIAQLEASVASVLND
ncbi:MAG: DUF2092 domain-containing protein [Capsulimonas sp.]|uniref:DUF2092 domain-containing protein n=1 Tax=Capsulimonas sp. TaxID=2494211 RepID=UPI00326575A9